MPTTGYRTFGVIVFVLACAIPYIIALFIQLRISSTVYQWCEGGLAPANYTTGWDAAETNQRDSLNRIYFNPRHTGSYGGVDRLRRAARTSENTARQWLCEQDTYTLHKPVRYRFKRRHVVVGGQNQQWQADLVDVSNLKKHNDGTTFLLTVIDVFSKHAWCIQL